MAGYSGTPLLKKLGIKEGHAVYVVSPPADYMKLLGELPQSARVIKRWSGAPDIIHLFSADRKELLRLLSEWRKKMPQNGMIWVSWPKKASKIPSTITEDVIREIALPIGLVDVKVCAIDEVWSGLKLVIRVTEREKV